MNGADFLVFIALLCAIESTSSQYVVPQDAISSFSVKQGEFSCKRNLHCSGNATTTAGGLLNLTPDPPRRSGDPTYFYHTVGVALYNKPVQLLDLTTKQVVSLSISFSFRIESGNGPGDGMAFVMFANETWVGSDGYSLGAYGRDGFAGVNTLAVEFDTFFNEGIDYDENHVGIDTSNIMSDKAKFAPFKLAEAYRVYAWVDYDSATSILQVRVNNASDKPIEAIITYRKNLKDVFNEQTVWVGFSGSNGFCSCFNYYTVYDLSFTRSSGSSLPPSLPPVVREDPKQELNSTAVKSQKSSNSTGLIAGVLIGVAGILLGGCLLLACPRLRNRKIESRLIPRADRSPGDGATVAQDFLIAGLSNSHRLQRYSYNQLCIATNNFSDALKLGEGGFGSVYLASFPGTNPEMQVAVKKVSSDSTQGQREFVAEVSTIGLIRHRNIVQLLGWCSEGEGTYLLVYEFMPNGSLDRHLFPRRISQQTLHESVLSWKQRIKILLGLGEALEYLHEGWRQQVIHRDIKSSNVMLDDNFNSMLGDFGLARIEDHNKDLATTGVAGTYGYIAPEAPMTGKYTVKTDVFAFGAVCLEVVCGRKVYDENHPADEVLLLDYVWGKLSADKLLSVVDRRLEGEYDVHEVEVVLCLGLLCSHPKPGERPSMHRAVEILTGSVEIPPIPKKKPEGEHYSYRSLHRKKRLFLRGQGTSVNEVGHPEQLNSPAFTISSFNYTRSRTRSSHSSGLTSPGCGDSFNHSYHDAEDTS